MKSESCFSSTYLKHATFVLVLFAMLAQSSMQIMELLSDSNYEIVSIDAEVDIEEKEHQEEDSKEEKVEFHTTSLQHQIASNLSTSPCTKLSFLYTNIYLKAHIPPPEFI